MKSEFLLERFDKQNKLFFQSQVSRLGLRCLFLLLLKNITHRNPGVKQLNVIDARKRALSPICVLRIVNLTPRGMLRMSHSQMPLKARWISVYTFQREKGYQVELLLEGKKVSMEVDTGFVVSIISEREYNNLLKDLQLRPTRIHLKTYSGEQLPLL